MRGELLGFSLIMIIGGIFILGEWVNRPMDNIGPKPDPLFSIKMVVGGSNRARMQYAQLFEEELRKIGIDAELDIITWASFCSDPSGPFLDYDYDLTFWGLSLGTPGNHIGTSLNAIYGSESVPPNGLNIGLWSPVPEQNYYTYRAQESDSLIQNIITNLNRSAARESIIEWQKVWYDAMPNINIYNEYEVHAVSTGFYGYDPVTFPFNSIETQWFDEASKDTVTLASSTGADTFNALLVNDIYDLYSVSPVMDGLVGKTPSIDIILPVEVERETWMTSNFGTNLPLALYPRIATALGDYSADGLQYNITLRDDVYWHDGHLTDAWDVAFSFQARLIPEIGSEDYSNLKIAFGRDSKTEKLGNYSFMVEDKDTDGFYEHISFQFVTPYSPWETNYLGSALFPEHILGDPVNHGFVGGLGGDFDPVSQWQVTPAEWGSHSTNTGRTSDPGGYAGPIGNGPVYFDGFDIDSGNITLKKFEGMVWGGSAFIPNASVNHWNIAKLDIMPSIAKIIVASQDASIASMKVDQANIHDPQFLLQNVLEELQAESTIQPALIPETGWQGIFLNPLFEQNGTYHFHKKGVRHALSHIVPRNDIIEHLLDGLGIPSYTPFPSNSWAAISAVEMLSYKKTVVATDGSTPEEDSTTMYDEYNIGLALDWLATEGYQVDYYRSLLEPTVVDQAKLSIIPILLALTFTRNLMSNYRQKRQ
ncbi:MAG: ABC transporter substrate-binding protein [Candidatus Hodarchaeales archaeon]|jgi:ABC-type transport system substrate-binding protein